MKITHVDAFRVPLLRAEVHCSGIPTHHPAGLDYPAGLERLAS